ncbi:hypothetical protein [Borrelia sp. CA_690]|uniref:hypothetical protein n=1 Tax=Borrelia sp. CA_690 TaxID=2419518 RepID=UPI0026472937|nr:hypothetical protein [Borrelia sp. CA_690]
MSKSEFNLKSFNTPILSLPELLTKFYLKAFLIFSVLKYEYCLLEFKSNLFTSGLKKE